MILPEGISGVAFGEASDGNPRLDSRAARRLAEKLGLGPDWGWVRQVHGSRVVVVDEPGIVSEGDALFTSDPGIPVAVSTADCFPVAVMSDEAVGMAHAGWRGTALGVVPGLLESMAAAGANPHTVVIGPGIRRCCFEVGPDVQERFAGFESSTTWGSRSVDLPAAIVASVGGAVRVVDTGECTHHAAARYHSFRRDGTDERQFGVTWLARG